MWIERNFFQESVAALLVAGIFDQIFGQRGQAFHSRHIPVLTGVIHDKRTFRNPLSIKLHA